MSPEFIAVMGGFVAGGCVSVVMILFVRGELDKITQTAVASAAAAELQACAMLLRRTDLTYSNAGEQLAAAMEARARERELRVAQIKKTKRMYG